MAIWLTICLLLATAASLAAWMNTHLIRKELQSIKNHLNIKEEKIQPFIKNDLDS